MLVVIIRMNYNNNYGINPASYYISFSFLKLLSLTKIGLLFIADNKLFKRYEPSRGRTKG